MTKTIGIIGLGSIGLRHKENLWKHLGQTEVMGYDTDIAKHIGSGWIVGDLGKMIEMSDAIIIASPTPMHLEHILAADGKPTFVEKPIADKLPVIKSSVLMVGYNLRFHSCVKKAREWMQCIGTPFWANFTLGQHSDKPPYLRDGVVLNWSHELDLCLYLLGPGRVAGSSTRLSNGRDDITDILITHDNGCRSSVHLDYVTNPEVRQFIIAGSNSTIIVDVHSRLAWLCDKDGIIDNFEGPDSWNENYIEEMQAFLNRCDGKKTLGCTADEALEVLKICLEVRKQAGLL